MPELLAVRDYLQEIEVVAGMVQKALADDSSLAFKDMALLVPDDDRYLSAVNMVFSHAGIPLFPDACKKAQQVEKYLLRCLLAGAFSGHFDRLLDALIKKFSELKKFDCDEAFGIIRTQNRSLALTADRFWQIGYGSSSIHLLFNLSYDSDYKPAYNNNLPQIDHIFPQSVLEKVKTINPATGVNNVEKYRKMIRNQLANCMLLTQVF